MDKQTALSMLKVTIIGSKVLKDTRSVQLVDAVKRDKEGRFDVAAFVRIQQTEEIDDKLYLFVCQRRDDEYRIFPLTEIYLNPSKQEDAEGQDHMVDDTNRIITDGYHIIQNCKFNFLAIPPTPPGVYALVVSTKENDPSGLLDAYYFRVE